MIRRTACLSLFLLLTACAQASRIVPVPSPAPAAILPPPVQPPPQVPIPPSPPRGEPTGYLGLPQANLRAQFGAPQLMRRDGGTQMWRYDGAQCRAFFFLQGPAGAETVLHVETVPAGAASAADPLCLAALRSARKPS